MHSRILMVGPDINGLGGISRVARTWKESGLFEELGVEYIPTVSDFTDMRLVYFIRHYYTFFKLLYQCQLVYIHTSSNKSFYRKSIYMLTSLVFRKRTIVHIHPTHFYDFLNSINGVVKIFSFALLRRVSGFITLTETMQKNMTILFPGKPVIVLRNPVDVACLNSGAAYKRRNDRLLYLGWYIKEKGIYELVDAVESILREGYEVTLDFYGTKDSLSLKQYVTDKGLNGSIHVNGWIEVEKKRKVLCECTMLVLPSYSEGIPNVILEAMATRTPIVSTLVGGLAEILKDNANAVVAKERDAVDLARKIRLCLDDVALRKQIADTAYMEAINKYDIQVLKEQIKEILTSQWNNSLKN